MRKSCTLPRGEDHSVPYLLVTNTFSANAVEYQELVVCACCTAQQNNHLTADNLPQILKDEVHTLCLFLRRLCDIVTDLNVFLVVVGGYNGLLPFVYVEL